MSKITDDAMVARAGSGSKGTPFEGSYRNIKITTPEDLASAESFVKH